MRKSDGEDDTHLNLILSIIILLNLNITVTRRNLSLLVRLLVFVLVTNYSECKYPPHLREAPPARAAVAKTSHLHSEVLAVWRLGEEEPNRIGK